MTLHPDHLADLRRSVVTDETIRVAGIYSVPPDEIGKKLGGGDAGIISLLAFPYPNCEGHERFKCWYEEGKSGPKYRQPKGAPNRLYIPPGVDLAGVCPLVVGEGEKKTLALWQEGFQAVGISGVWNWCEKGEGYKKPKESPPIPDLDRVSWRRPVTILFDSDGAEPRKPPHLINPVRLAAFRLARELSKRGAAVSILFLEAGPNGEKMGGDDFLVAYGPEKLWEMML